MGGVEITKIDPSKAIWKRMGEYLVPWKIVLLIGNHILKNSFRIKEWSPNKFLVVCIVA